VNSKMPPWVVPFLIAALGVAVAWGQAKAETTNLKSENKEIKETIKPLVLAFAEIPRIKEDISDIRNTQKEMQSQQMAFQSEIQRDIKALLAKRN